MKPILTTEEFSNRDFKLPADRWYQIVPIGDFPHPTGAIQRIDAEAISSIVNRFSEEAKAPNFPGLLVDFDHGSNDPSQPSTAAGWITKLENRGDGLWAQIRWSDLGEKAVIGGRFRLVSPVWNRGDCDAWKGSVDGKETLFLRPRRLDRVAVTNDPNIKGMAPLSNRADEPASPIDCSEVTNLREKRQALLNKGTSAGAKKGWETRRAAGWEPKSKSGKTPKSGMAKRVAAKKGSRQKPSAAVAGGKVTTEKQVHLLHLGEHPSDPQYKIDLSHVRASSSGDGARKEPSSRDKVSAKTAPSKAKSGFFSRLVQSFSHPGYGGFAD